MNERYDSPCSPTHMCTDQEIQNIIHEHMNIESDKTITTYNFPSIAEMETIISTAKQYSGKWYHSNVILNETKFISEEHENLKKRIIKLGADNGIYITYQVDLNQQDEKKFLTILSTS